MHRLKLRTGFPMSVLAGVATSNGINANIVHRWLRKHAGQESSKSGFVAPSLPPSQGLQMGDLQFVEDTAN